MNLATTGGRKAQLKKLEPQASTSTWNFAWSAFTSFHSFIIRSGSGSEFSHLPNSHWSSGRTFSTVHSLCPVLMASRSLNFHLA